MRFLSLILFSFFFIGSYAQPECGFEQLDIPIEPSDPLLPPSSPCDDVTGLTDHFTIPVVFHQFHNTEHSGFIALDLPFFEQIISEVNDFFPDNFTFQLSRVDPDGNCTDGVNYIGIENEANTTMNLEVAGEELAWKDMSRWDPERYLNIWVFRWIQDESGSILSTSAFTRRPDRADFSLELDGIVAAHSSGGFSGDVIAHEIGHYLGLLHVWGQNRSDDANCHALSESCVAGDLVDDTNPVRSGQDIACAFDLGGSGLLCPGGVDADYPKENLMSFHPCRDRFTDGQVDRMIRIANQFRSVLISNTTSLNLASAHEGDLIVSQDMTLNSISVTGDIIVQAGATLTIDGTVFMNPFRSIIVYNGARLVVDNGLITKSPCFEDRWGGIYPVAGVNQVDDPFSPLSSSNSGIIVIRNNSIIEESYSGVTNISHPFCAIFDCGVDNNGLVVAENSTFHNNRSGAVFFQNRITNNSYFDQCTFEDNEYGAWMIENNGVVFDACVFQNMTSAGLHTFDSFIRVTGDNRFINNRIGIESQGTFPLGSGLHVGDMDLPVNLFDDNGHAVVSSGSTAPGGVHVINNRFTNNTSTAGALVGDNDYGIHNNEVTGSLTGVLGWATRDGMSEVGCNEVHNIASGGLLYIGDNSGSTFLQNDFNVGTPIYNMGVAYGTIRNQIGAPDNPAGNCFITNGAEDIRTFDNTSFRYWYRDVTCEEPMTVGNYELRASVSPPTWCEVVGPFNLIDPDGDGEDGIKFEDIPETYCEECLKDSLDVARNELALVEAALAADPSNDELQAKYYVDLAKKHQWINYLLYLSIRDADYTLGESVLEEESLYRWQIRLFGLHLWQRDYDAAENVLNSLPTDNDDRMAFKDVQVINIARLRTTDSLYTLSSTERDRLIEIAESSIPASGYARSVFQLLTSEELEITIPDIPEYEDTTNTRGKRMFLDSDLQVVPNPAPGPLVVQFAQPVETATLTLFDQQGRQVLAKVLRGTRHSVELDVSEVPAGLYLMRIESSDGNVRTKKIVIE